MLLSVTPVGLRPLGSMRFPVAPVGRRPRGLRRCRVAPVVLRPRGSLGTWGRSAGSPFIIIAFVVLDGGSAGAQRYRQSHREPGAMCWLVAPVNFPPPGSLGPFGDSSAFLTLVGGSVGAHFFFVRHRETGAVLVEGWLGV